MNEIYSMVISKRKVMQVLIMYHILCLTLFVIGVYFTIKYFETPDRVIVMDIARNVYVGQTSDIVSRSAIIDMAIKATDVFLSRSYDFCNERGIKAIYSSSAASAVNKYIDHESKLFTERKISQRAEILKTKFVFVGNTPVVVVRGQLLRTGTYFDNVYAQTLKFRLVLFLERVSDPAKYPFNVINLKLKVEDI